VNRWKDWYEQGKRDLERGKLDKTHGYHEWACFTSQQAAEKVLEALGLRKGITLWGHSLTEMLNVLADRVEVEPRIRENAQLLDLYYIPSRYPNGFSAGKPADYFSEKKAEEGLNAAQDIIRFCERNLSGQPEAEEQDT